MVILVQNKGLEREGTLRLFQVLLKLRSDEQRMPLHDGSHCPYLGAPPPALCRVDVELGRVKLNPTIRVIAVERAARQPELSHVGVVSQVEERGFVDRVAGAIVEHGAELSRKETFIAVRVTR